MTDEHLRELKRQTRMMAERSALKTLVICYFAFQLIAFLAAIYWPDYTPASPWLLIGGPIALGLLSAWADYHQNTRG